jgi:hypothetical protein
MSFYNSGIIDIEVDRENQWFLVVDSFLITFFPHSIVHFFSDDSSALISNSIQEIGPYAFARRYFLAAITFESPSIVVNFLDSAFLGCSSLESICIPASVRFIGNDCFLFCESLVSVTFEQPSMLEIINDDAFNYCKSLSQISIPASVQQIGTGSFVECDSLISITFESPSHLVELCDLGNLIITALEIPDSVEVISGMTTSSREGSLVVSFGVESRLSIVYPRQYPQQGIGAFVRYSERTLRRFRANFGDFATLS